MYDLIEKIEECFSTCTEEAKLDGRKCVDEFYGPGIYLDMPSKDDIIMRSFYIHVYAKAKKYNNPKSSDKKLFDSEVNHIIYMCQQYHGFRSYNQYLQIKDNIEYLWRKAGENALFNLIGYICIQNNLPGGDPCWIAPMIGSYLERIY
jgi:hypothetical protein